MDRRVKDVESCGGLPRPREGLTLTAPASPGTGVQIEVHVSGARDPQATARAVLDELRDKARAQTGDTLDFGRLV